MSLTIEDGTGVDGADSYAEVADARAYADARGLELPVDDGDVEQLLVKAADFLDSLESRYKGSRVLSDQALAWPRSNVYLFDDAEAFPEDSIPSMLVRAQCQLAFDFIAQDLQPTGTGRETLKEKVDVIEVEYAERGSGTILPNPTKALAILEPLLQSGGFGLTTVRV